MIFSKSCEYGIRAVIYVAKNSNNGYTGLKQIAKETQVPVHFLSKILQMLVKRKLLKSAKGKTGGFSLNKNPAQINLLSVIKAIDGLDIFDMCVIGLKVCSDSTPCPVHFQYKPLKDEFVKILARKTIQDLMNDLEEGKTFLAIK